MQKSEIYKTITVHLVRGTTGEAQLLIDANRERLSESEYKECLGNLCFYRREHQNAVLFYEEAMTLTPEHDCARYHYILGVQAEQAGELTDAFDRYQAAIEIEPEFVDAYIELGGLFCKVADFEGAAQCYRDASAIDPTDIAIRHNLVQVLSELAAKDPAAYSLPLQKAQAEYDAAKTSSAPPDPDRVW